MRTLSGELRRLKATVAKLPIPKPGVGEDWLRLWRWLDDVDGAERALPRDVPRGAAEWLVCHRHARAFALDTRPDVVGALRDAAAFLAVQWHPPPGIDWQQRNQLQELVRSTLGDAWSLLWVGFGTPDGPMGEHPAGGRPPPNPVPTTADEIADVIARIATPPPFDLAWLAEDLDEPAEQKSASR